MRLYFIFTWAWARSRREEGNLNFILIENRVFIVTSVLSMADLFSYLLPYPGSVLCRTLIPNLNFLVSLLVLLIVTALFGRFKKIIPHYLICATATSSLSAPS